MENITTEEKLNDFLQAVEDGLKNLNYGELKTIVDTITDEMKNKIVINLEDYITKSISGCFRNINRLL